MMAIFRGVMLLAIFLSLLGCVGTTDDQEGRRFILMMFVSGGLFLLSLLFQ